MEKTTFLTVFDKKKLRKKEKKSGKKMVVFDFVLEGGPRAEWAMAVCEIL